MVWGGLLPIPFYRIHTRLVYYTRLEQRKKKTLLVGKKDKISNYRGRSVYLVHVDLKHRYYNLLFIYKGCPIQVRSKSLKLISLVGRDNPPQIIIL